MEKAIRILKLLYLIVVGAGFVYFSYLIYKDYGEREQYYTYLNIVSALIVIFLLWLAVSSIFSFVVGILLRIDSKGELVKKKDANKIILLSVAGFVSAFLMWAFINLISVFI